MMGVETGVMRQWIGDAEFHGDRIILQGKEVANFGLCCYLGLSDDPRLTEAAKDALDHYGNSYSSSIAYTSLPMYRELHEMFEEIFGAPVILAASTTLAHLAALPVLVRPPDRVVVDAQAHASILAITPTLQVNGSKVETIRHNDMTQLGGHLADADGRRVWFLTDGVFSMHGDTVPAEDLMALLDAHPNLHVYCDDAHGFGWEGEHGRGNFLRRVGWHPRLVISVGLAKSFGTMGGVVATPDRDVIDMISITGGPLVFGGPIPPATLGASIASARIHLSSELDTLQDQLNERIDFVNEFSQEIGLRLSRRDHTPLWFLEIGKARDVAEFAGAIKDRGFYLNPASFPVVPRGHGGVRFTVTNYNSIEQIENMLVALNNLYLEWFGETEIEIDLGAEETEPTRPSDAARG
jgi:7-keto-8-aminopelargonate synthetase-like enzyme